jgi:hypothetical protein
MQRTPARHSLKNSKLVISDLNSNPVLLVCGLRLAMCCYLHGREFESLRARQTKPGPWWAPVFFVRRDRTVSLEARRSTNLQKKIWTANPPEGWDRMSRIKFPGRAMRSTQLQLALQGYAKVPYDRSQRTDAEINILSDEPGSLSQA